MNRSFAFAAPEAEPISALNTTPLIDVMLVLLIMFIVTIPISTHKVSLDLPRSDLPIVEKKPHMLDLDRAGRLYWDGAAIPEARLPAYLAALKKAGPEAVLHFRADGETRYEPVDRVLAAIKRAGIARFGLVDIDRFVRVG